MFDFPMEKSSIWTSLYCLITFFLILKANYKEGLKYPFIKKVDNRKEKWTYVLICFFFITHCIIGDFFYLMEHVYNYIFIPGYYNFGEEIYHIIAKIVDKNYLLFRTVVWGGSFALFCWSAKRLEVPVYYAVFFLFATHSITFSYARATAAMAMYFWGLSFLCKPLSKFKWTSYLIGITIIYLSWAFHNSALIMIIMTIMLFVPLRKWNIIAVIFLIPMFSILLEKYLFLFAQETTNETLANKINDYSERDITNGISGIIIKLFEYLSFYIPFILSSLCIFKNRNRIIINSSILCFYKVTFGLFLTCTTFYFIGDSFVVFFYRILFMTMIPLSLIVVKLYQQKMMNLKQYRLCYVSGVIFLFLRYFYDIYLNILAL